MFEEGRTSAYRLQDLQEGCSRHIGLELSAPDSETYTENSTLWDCTGDLEQLQGRLLAVLLDQEPAQHHQLGGVKAVCLCRLSDGVSGQTQIWGY